MEKIISRVFLILGTLIASLIIFYLLFSGSTQTILWRGIRTIIQNEWSAVTYDNGYERTEIYEDIFDTIR